MFRVASFGVAKCLSDFIAFGDGVLDIGRRHFRTDMERLHSLSNRV